MKRLFKTTLATASFFNTTTKRCPKRSFPSSLTSAIPAIFPSLTRSAIFNATLSGFTWYGSSLTTKHVRPLISSTSTTARMVIDPRPVRYASSIPWRPTTKPLVGKSGPFTNPSNAPSNSELLASGCSRDHCTPRQTSVRLCGGIFVAIPTAIPALPLTKRLGKRLGKTVGSSERPS